MRLALLFLCVTALSAAPAAEIPPAVSAALANFRPEGPKGWSFTQRTTAEGRSLVEHYDSTKPEFSRWTLVTENGQVPTPEAAQRYREKFTRLTQNSGAPRLHQQIDLPSLRVLADTDERATYQARLKTTETGDRTGAFLRALIVWHKSAASIESFTIENTEPFSPAFGVKIQEMRTIMAYNVPTPDHPALLTRVSTRLRGRAFWVKSLDADMEVTYADYTPARPRRAVSPDQRP